ncbi:MULTISPECIES: hypothetical protein [unclassified Caballeronia]|uniref:hypothetical protein n=1 Tax=unclassified Caballeronia TaxID=2646786 RepID=UPI00202950AB|nr:MULTISPECIES: hypothetical protein [unclassified Caballeronia]
MPQNPIFADPSRDGEIARAISIALEALVVHHGIAAHADGDVRRVDFSQPIESLRAALALLGVGRNEFLPYMRAPAKPDRK